MDFSQKTMLLRLSIGQWTAKKKDKNATEAVQARFHADSDSGQFQKILISPKYTKPIAETVSALRGFHDANTLPWLYAGWRIIPTRHHAEYMAGFRMRKADFFAKVADFISEYDSAKKRAQISLGSLYNPMEYPPAELLSERFRVDLTPQRFPDHDDWRADIADNEMEILRRQAMESTRAGLENAQREAWARLSESLATLAAKLKIPHGAKGPDNKALKNADGETGIFKGSFNAFLDLLEVLPALNLFEDPNLDAIIQETRERIGSQTEDAFRADSVGRIVTAAAADDILEKMAGFTGGGALSLKPQSVGE